MGREKKASDLGALDWNAILRTEFTAGNDWQVRHARRLVQEGGPRPFMVGGMFFRDSMRNMFPMVPIESKDLNNLRSLWLELCHPGKADPADVAPDALDHSTDPLFVGSRAWCVSLLAAAEAVRPESLACFERLAGKKDSPVVRLYLASAAQRLPFADRWKLLTALVAHPDDATDQNLPLMYWYAIEPCVPTDPARAAKLAADSKIPLVREFIARRLAMIADTPALAAAVSILTAGDDAAKSQALKGMTDGFVGKRTVPMPESWPAIYDQLSTSGNAEVKQRALSIATLFGDPHALAILRKTLADPTADVKQRLAAMESLLAAKDTATLPLLQQLLPDPALRAGAIRGLAAYEDNKTPGLLLAAYPTFVPPERLAALNTLASRLPWAKQLLTAIQDDKIPPADLTAPTIRNLYSLSDPALNEWIAKHWGNVRATPAEKTKEIEKYKIILKPELLVKADARNGRAIFVKTCMQCHTLFDAGAKIGPDLTAFQPSECGLPPGKHHRSLGGDREGLPDGQRQDEGRAIHRRDHQGADR